jgi:hypothetical protein
MSNDKAESQVGNVTVEVTVPAWDEPQVPERTGTYKVEIWSPNSQGEVTLSLSPYALSVLVAFADQFNDANESYAQPMVSVTKVVPDETI